LKVIFHRLNPTIHVTQVTQTKTEHRSHVFKKFDHLHHKCFEKTDQRLHYVINKKRHYLTDLNDQITNKFAQLPSFHDHFEKRITQSNKKLPEFSHYGIEVAKQPGYDGIGICRRQQRDNIKSNFHHVIKYFDEKSQTFTSVADGQLKHFERLR
jgi:hypothetical protein